MTGNGRFMWVAVENRTSLRYARPLEGPQGEHLLEIPARRHQVPFAANVRRAPQPELSVPHRRFDAAENRLRGLIELCGRPASSVDAPSARARGPWAAAPSVPVQNGGDSRVDRPHASY